MSGRDMEDPRSLLRRLKLGREEYCQRLLTMLILEGSYPRWNTRSKVATRGREFLERLDVLCFGSGQVDGELEFVDELDLPSTRSDQRGSAPDYGVLGTGRLWMIELKTEAASHRPSQLPEYAALGAHHFPGVRHDLTYLTPAMSRDVPAPAGVRFAHVIWDDVIPIVADVWGDAAGTVADCRDSLLEALGSFGHPWATWRGTTLDDVVSSAEALARRTALDGHQRAVDTNPASLDGLYEERVAINAALESAGGTNVRAWVWRADSSGGSAMTSSGQVTGYEIRLSRAGSPGAS